MSGRVCANCGKKVIGEYCFDPSCKDYFQKRWEKRVNEKINDYQSEIELLNSFEVDALILDDYSKLKKIRQEAKEWEKKLGTSSVKSEVETLLQNIEEVEKRFPEKIRLKSKGKSKDCFHKNIHWTDFFKKEKTEDAYCLDYGEDKSEKFSAAFQRWYYKKISEWLVSNGLKCWEFDKYLRGEKYNDIWSELQRGKLEDAINDFMGQSMMWEAAKNIEEYCLEFAKQKGVKVDNTNNNPNQRRKTEQLQQEITNLTNKPNKTPEEEQELADKQEQLGKLNKPDNSEQTNNNSWLIPTLIIGGTVLIIGLIILLSNKNKKKNVH